MGSGGTEKAPLLRSEERDAKTDLTEKRAMPDVEAHAIGP
jgi:hypothetical protein